MQFILELDYSENVQILNFDNKEEVLFKSECNDFFLDAYYAIKYYVDYLSENTIALFSESFDTELKNNNGILAFINEQGDVSSIFNNKSMEIYIPNGLEINNIKDYKNFINSKIKENGKD